MSTTNTESTNLRIYESTNLRILNFFRFFKELYFEKRRGSMAEFLFELQQVKEIIIIQDWLLASDEQDIEKIVCK